MGVLDQIMQMRSQGVKDPDIILQLQEQGISPKAINDAINQANIKGAIEEVEPSPQAGYSDDYTPIPQPMENVPRAEAYPSDDFYTPQAEAPQPYEYQTMRPSQSYQEFYPQQENGEANIGMDADTMIEISQQVFAERIKKIQQQIEELNEFKTVYQTKVDGIFERLKRMEGIIDTLQSAILEKIGSYGSGVESVKKELSMMQDSYGKIINAVASHQHHEHHSTSPQYQKIVRLPSVHKIHHSKKTSKKFSRKKKH